MISVSGEFRGLHAGGYGRVHVQYSDPSDALHIGIVLDDDEWNDQLRTGNFQDWIDAAVYGVRFALNQANIANGKWMITRIVGLLVDTHPTIVAVAAARATWSAAGFEPSPELDSRVQTAALEASPEDVPRF